MSELKTWPAVSDSFGPFFVLRLKKALLTFVALALFLGPAGPGFTPWASETCGRAATINFQEVLIDNSSSEKGEGLRPYLEKEPKAKHYLEIYQRKGQIQWPQVLWGSLGTGLLLAGFIHHDKEKQKGLLFSGAVITMTNFLLTRTLENANENNLIRAIEEYNKKNLPKIYLNTNLDGDGSKTFAKISIKIAQSWSF